MRRSVLARLANQRLEEGCGLGVPLNNADREAPGWILDSLERPVGRPRRLDKAFPDAPERLVVM